MSLRKLTAGDGYTYLTRQVATHDTIERGFASLGDYYSAKGESPGVWLGQGLAGLDVSAGAVVTEAHMRHLFGEGRHPCADGLVAVALDAGYDEATADAAGSLGHPFRVHTGASEFNIALAKAYSDHNCSQGRHWRTPIVPEIRAGIRTEVALARFREEHSRDPQNDRELAGFVARKSRQATTAVAGYDLTFSPPKSVSALWALATPEVADAVVSAHRAAIEDTLEWLEREAAFTRLGNGGVRQVPTRGLVAVAFTHRDSRAGDPDLHTHTVISNKVQAADGRWLALDGRMIYKANVAASERYNTRIEAELVERLGVRFVDRGDIRNKRPVREIEGIEPRLLSAWSSRRRSIEVRRTDLATRFQAEHSRPPTAVEAIALAQQATLETRNAKHEPRSEAEQRVAWRGQAAAVLGDESGIDTMVKTALHRPSERFQLTEAWVSATATRAVDVLEESRATWQPWHVTAEAERQARAGDVPLDLLDKAVGQVVSHVLTVESQSLGKPDPVNEPQQLRRPDAASVYEVHNSRSYTSARILEAEQRLVRAARRTGGRFISDVRVGIELAAQAAHGTALNDAQAEMVRELATSGRRLQLALAPAGTGKTTAMTVLTRAWHASNGYVVGLAPSAAAAQELGQAITAPTDTLAMLIHSLRHCSTPKWPDWMRQIGPQTLVIIDEAGQAGTRDLADAVEFVINRGGSVRLIGDDQQLASVAAGGALRDIAQSVGAATLTEVRRFESPAEAAATLALRDGDPAAIGFYADHGRIHVGDLGAATDQAYRAWAADRERGLDSILLAPTRELVSQLNARARADRLTEQEPGVEVLLDDGTAASAGDVIVTRRNERRLIVAPTDWVKNGDRWIVLTAGHDGSLRVKHRDHGRVATLPPAYVAEHVQLGYATTVHAAQGLTVETTHAVATGEEPRQLLYVGLSRGRIANHLYLASAYDGDPHSVVRPETLLPATPIDIITEILARDGSQQSASSTRRAFDDSASQLHEAVRRYLDAVAYAAEEHLGPDALGALDQQANARLPGLTEQPAYPALRSHLAVRAADGHEPVADLTDAIGERELGTADDPAAVLEWRLGGQGIGGPLPWLAPVPTDLKEDARWGSYLDARASRVSSLANLVRADADSWSVDQAPRWAASLTAAEDATLRADLAVWRAAYGVAETDARPTGPTQHAAAAGEHQRRLGHRHQEATGHHRGPGFEDELPHSVKTDPRYPVLRDHLDRLDRAGADVPRLLAAALAEPRPLPTEVAADGLWWRLVAHLGPAAVHTTSSLRPDWVPVLVEAIGERAAERVMLDRSWPALVAAVAAAVPDWDPAALVRTATSCLIARDGTALLSAEIAETLVYRIANLTDPPYDPDDAPPPPDPADEPFAAEPQQVLAQPGTPAERIAQLNEQAAAYYEALLPKSWVPDYVNDRITAEVLDDPRYRLGYAPPGPTSLLRHLVAHGATDAELADAGLVRRTDRGHLVDAFRDRLVFPIRRGTDIVGFIGRRNPTKGDDQYAGPKYLNTRSTLAFTKGELLYGLSEGMQELERGAAPVLVEGPMDAIAVTLASNGRAVGIAPLGTAFTEAQAEQLGPWVRRDPSSIIVATDPDRAGWESAQRAYWHLCALGANPHHLSMPDGIDPADLMRLEGPEALAVALAEARPLSGALLDELLSKDVSEAAARLRVVRESAQIIGALPPEQWLGHIERVLAEVDAAPGALHMEVVDAGQAWTNDPCQLRDRRLSEQTAKRVGPVGQARRPRPGRHGTAMAVGRSATRAAVDAADVSRPLG